MESEAQRRIAANEAVFRDVNEGIARGQWPGEVDDPVAFRCECAGLSCNVLIELTMRAYEGVRADPRRFVVAVGHVVPNTDAEAVVEERPGYVVVEKRNEAGAVAETRDPRD